MVKCDNCETDNNDEDNFCIKCGKPLNKYETVNNNTSDRKFNLTSYTYGCNCFNCYCWFYYDEWGQYNSKRC